MTRAAHMPDLTTAHAATKLRARDLDRTRRFCRDRLGREVTQ